MVYILLTLFLIFILIMFFIWRFYEKNEKIINRNRGVIEFFKFHKQIICKSTYYNFENLPTKTFNYKKFLEKLDQKSCFEFSKIFKNWQENKNFKLPKHKIAINQSYYHVKSLAFKKTSKKETDKMILEFIPIMKNYNYKKIKIKAIDVDKKNAHILNENDYIFLINLSNHKKYIDKYGRNHYLFLIKKVIKFLQKNLKKINVLNHENFYYVTGKMPENKNRLIKKVNNFLNLLMSEELFYDENKIQTWGVKVTKNLDSFNKIKTKFKVIKNFSKSSNHLKRVLIFDKTFKNEKFKNYVQNLKNIKKINKEFNIKITPLLNIQKPKKILNFICNKDVLKGVEANNFFSLKEIFRIIQKFDLSKKSYFFPINLNSVFKISEIKKIEKHLDKKANNLNFIVNYNDVNEIVAKNISLFLLNSKIPLSFSNIESSWDLKEILIFKPKKIFLAKNLIEKISKNPIKQANFLKIIKVCEKNEIAPISLDVENLKTLNLLYNWNLKYWSGKYLENNVVNQKISNTKFSDHLNKIIH